MEQLFLTLLAVSVAVTIAALVVLLPRLPLASMEKTPEKRVKHLLDYKHPGIWVTFMAVAVCILSGTILLADPGQKAEQYEGVALTVGELIREESITPLSDDLRNDLVAILHDYQHTPYQNIDSVELADNTIKLTNENEGTMFFFHPETLTLVRVNHDGYSNIRKLAYVDEAMAEDPDFLRWKEEMALYARTGRAEELFAMKTPYVGNPSAVGELINALGIPEVVGDYGYTMELQTDTEPYGITLHFENYPMLNHQREDFTRYIGAAGECLLELVDNAKVFSWTYDSPWGSTGGTTEPDKSQSAFQLRYDRMQEAARDFLAVQALDTLRTTEVLYVSEDHPFDLWSYSGTFTLQPKVFTATWTSLLSSAWPETETLENYRYDDHLSAEILETYYPNADSLQLDRYSMLGTHCYSIYDANNQDTGYRIFELIPINQDGVTIEPDYYVAHMTFSGEVQDWVLDYLVKAELGPQ